MPTPQNIADLRRDYRLASLDETSAGSDPIDLFQRWFDDAVQAQVPEPNGMTVVSVDAEGRPSARILLLKGVDARGFTFYTNYASRKGTEFNHCPHGALVFWWADLERQVRVEGEVSKVDPLESDAYFQSRPLNSRIGAWSSPQSKPIADRSVLEQAQAEYAERFGEHPPRPPHWAATDSKPTPSNSGRDAHRACTTASALNARQRWPHSAHLLQPCPGACNGSRPELRPTARDAPTHPTFSARCAPFWTHRPASPLSHAGRLHRGTHRRRQQPLDGRHGRNGDW
jgi:pyridoxamine 5'-phosphate oxidase